MADVVTIATTALGNRSYVVTDGTSVVVIDAPRDIDRVTAILDERDLHLTHVLETHIHNDYVTGGFELAARTGADYVVAADDEVSFERRPVHDGDEITSGTLRLRALHTPGHTHTHLSYLLLDGDRPTAVFTGGSLLYGTVGRSDLLGADATEQLTRAQFRSAHRLAELPPDVAVYPTHGFGSFCASGTSTDIDASTIGDERRGNTALVIADEDEFVAITTAGLDAYPRYYAHMAPINRAGPSPVDLSPPRQLTPETVRERIRANEWVVDVRNRVAFAAGHVPGTVNVELGDSLATYVGWAMPWGTPVTLVGDTPEEVAEAQRMLVRIGIDRPAGSATGGPDRYGAGADLASYRVSDFPGLAKALANGGAHVLDVRRAGEWNDGHVDGAQHIPLPDLEQRIDEVPTDRETWVHCASGYRAAIAASLLDRTGRDVVLIDDEWETAQDAGVPVTTPQRLSSDG